MRVVMKIEAYPLFEVSLHQGLEFAECELTFQDSPSFEKRNGAGLSYRAEARGDSELFHPLLKFFRNELAVVLPQSGAGKSGISSPWTNPKRRRRGSTNARGF